MKHCTNCGLQLNDEIKFCPDCGQEQLNTTSQTTAQKSTPAIVIVLCILTILGSAFGLIRGLFYEAVAGIAENTDYWRGYAFAFCNLATLVGAIFMLNRKMLGFWIYIVFQVAYIGLVIFTTFIYSRHTTENMSDVGQTISSSMSALTIFFTCLFVVPSTILLVLFITMAQKHMNK